MISVSDGTGRFYLKLVRTGTRCLFRWPTSACTSSLTGVRKAVATVAKGSFNQLDLHGSWFTNSRLGRWSARNACTDETRSDAGKESSYLVDPASSHMLVSKIKPCMSKYKQICTVKLRMAH